MKKEFEYKSRDVKLDEDNQFVLGEGKISGYGAFFLGGLSLLAVIAYLYPSYLTTIELRQASENIYRPNSLSDNHTNEEKETEEISIKTKKNRISSQR